MNKIFNNFCKSVDTGSHRMNVSDTDGRKRVELTKRIRLKKMTKIQDVPTFRGKKETGFIHKMKMVNRNEDQECLTF